MSNVSYKINERNNIELSVECADKIFKILIVMHDLVFCFSSVNQMLHSFSYVGKVFIGYDMDNAYYIEIDKKMYISVYSEIIDDVDEDGNSISEYEQYEFDEETSNMIFNTLYQLLILYYESGEYKNNPLISNIDLKNIILNISDNFK